MALRRPPHSRRTLEAMSTRPDSSALDFGDPLDRPAPDESDEGWGERPSAGQGGAAELARFLDEKPPHHI